jgi:hypothetical protein
MGSFYGYNDKDERKRDYYQEEEAVKRAGELLSVFFNQNFVEKAQGYSNLFSCWTGITEKNGIPSAASHSRIVELEKAVLLVEADHPGWIQILQTKQASLLNTVIRRFPNLEIRGISFRLSRDPSLVSAASQSIQETADFSGPTVSDAVFSMPEAAAVPDGSREYFERIEDAAFLETLKRLEKLERRGKAWKKD